jgi:hypothetical protein
LGLKNCRWKSIQNEWDFHKLGVNISEHPSKMNVGCSHIVSDRYWSIKKSGDQKKWPLWALSDFHKSLGDGRKTPRKPWGSHRKTKVENPWFPGENMMEHDLEKVDKHHIELWVLWFFFPLASTTRVGKARNISFNDMTGRGWTGPAIGCLRIFPVKVFDQKVSTRVQDGAQWCLLVYKPF